MEEASMGGYFFVRPSKIDTFATLPENHCPVSLLKMRIYGLAFVILLLVCQAQVCVSQSTFLPVNDDVYHLIERYELKMGKMSSTFHGGVKPFERKAVMEFLDEVETDDPNLNDRDEANFQQLRRDSWEWTRDTSNVFAGRFQRLNRNGWPKSWWAHPNDLFSHHTDEFNIHVNFITNNFLARDNTLDDMVYFSGRGAELRGTINKKLGFYTMITDNQGYFPGYVQEYAQRLNFPGEGLTKISAKNHADFFSARGYISFNPLKNINVQFGHDKNFIGNGFRSLLLSDFSAPYMFLKLNTRIGRFHYTNLWSSMINNQDSTYGDLLRKKKYSAMHHLSVNITDRLNIGIFEAEVFTRDSTGGGFDINYLNPVIFYRFVESYLGSSDNALLGLDFRWILARNTSIYGQVMIDELRTKELFDGKNSWTRKFAFQLGAKRVDVLNIPNLDLQVEYNIVLPYTYSHRDGGRNYMHYKQPLAHPLEANFYEILGILRYQLSRKLTLYGVTMFSRKGLDLEERNYGGDLTRDYETRYSDTGNVVTQGLLQKINLFDLRLSYMLAQNLYIDYRMMNRRVAVQRQDDRQTNLFSFGIRYHLPYRQQIF